MGMPAEKIIDFERLKKERLISDSKENRNDSIDISVLKNIQLIIDEALYKENHNNKKYEQPLTSREVTVGDSDDNSILNHEVVKDENGLKKCIDLKEVEILKMKANVKIPKVIIAYILIFSMIFAVSSTLLVITFVTKKVFIDLGVTFIVLIGSFGLMITALVAIKDWRKFIKNV